MLMYVPLQLSIRASNNARIGGISTLVTQGTGRIIREVLPDDGRIDGEGCRQGYQVRDRLRRGRPVFRYGNQKKLTPSS